MKQVIYNSQGFEWDDDNSEKNWLLHEVSDGECEEVFFNQPLLVAADARHSQHESRHFVLGRTDADRWLFVAFTIRRNRIRVISARDMNQRERAGNMPKQSREIPRFTNEDEEREFWASHDSTDYVDWDEASAAVFPQLKPTTKSISLRLPLPMLNELRLLANKRDVPYQSLIKMFLHDRIDQELRRDIPKETV